MVLGKNINIGLGFSQNKDGYTAAKEAAEKAVKALKGKSPNLSFVFYAGHDYLKKEKEINNGLMETLKGTEFVGGSTDAVVYDGNIYPDGVLVASIQSDYLHFGVASTEDITKNPRNLAMETITKAVSAININQYVEPYMAFTRLKKGNLTEFIRVPPFFVFVLTRGFQPTKMGNEDLIIDGIQDRVGYYVPIFGGSLGNDMDFVFNGTPYDIISLHSGKIMKDGLITVFVSSDLKYANSFAHGAQPLKNIGFVSEIKEGGFVISKMSGKPIKEWYAEQIGISKDEFESKILFYTQKYPIGFPDGFGNIIMRAGGIPHPLGLAYIAPLKENTPVFVMNLENNKELLQANKELLEDIKNHLDLKVKPEISFVVSCSSRRRVLDKKSSLKELAELNKLSSNSIFGFCSFGEIGSKPAKASHFHHLCTNVFDIYDKMLSEQ